MLYLRSYYIIGGYGLLVWFHFHGEAGERLNKHEPQ